MATNESTAPVDSLEELLKFGKLSKNLMSDGARARLLYVLMHDNPAFNEVELS